MNKIIKFLKIFILNLAIFSQFQSIQAMDTNPASSIKTVSKDLIDSINIFYGSSLYATYISNQDIQNCLSNNLNQELFEEAIVVDNNNKTYGTTTECFKNIFLDNESKKISVFAAIIKTIVDGRSHSNSLELLDLIITKYPNEANKFCYWDEHVPHNGLNLMLLLAGNKLGSNSNYDKEYNENFFNLLKHATSKLKTWGCLSFTDIKYKDLQLRAKIISTGIRQNSKILESNDLYNLETDSDMTNFFLDSNKKLIESSSRILQSNVDTLYVRFNTFLRLNGLEVKKANVQFWAQTAQSFANMMGNKPYTPITGVDTSKITTNLAQLEFFKHIVPIPDAISEAIVEKYPEYIKKEPASNNFSISKTQIVGGIAGVGTIVAIITYLYKEYSKNKKQKQTVKNLNKVKDFLELHDDSEIEEMIEYAASQKPSHRYFYNKDIEGKKNPLKTPDFTAEEWLELLEKYKKRKEI